MRLWLALEIIAENVKERERVPPVCKGALKCLACDAEPTRFPMAKQAIEGLILIIVGSGEAQKVARRQFTARNGLMHGRSHEAIEKDCRMTMADLVDELGALAWRAIDSTIPRTGAMLHFGHRDGEFTNKSLIASANLLFEHDGEGPQPAEDKIPNAELTIHIRFGEEKDPVGRTE